MGASQSGYRPPVAGSRGGSMIDPTTVTPSLQQTFNNTTGTVEYQPSPEAAVQPPPPMSGRRTPHQDTIPREPVAVTFPSQGAPVSVMTENMWDSGRQQTGVDRNLLDNPAEASVGLPQSHMGYARGGRDMTVGSDNVVDFDAIHSQHAEHMLGESMHSGPDESRGKFQ